MGSGKSEDGGADLRPPSPGLPLQTYRFLVRVDFLAGSIPDNRSTNGKENQTPRSELKRCGLEDSTSPTSPSCFEAQQPGQIPTSMPKSSKQKRDKVQDFSVS